MMMIMLMIEMMILLIKMLTHNYKDDYKINIIGLKCYNRSII